MMKQRYFLKKDNTKIFTEYETYLRCEDRSENTIRKYMRDLRAFYTFLGRASLTKEAVLAWKRQLSESHALSSANSMLAAVNGFLDWVGAPQCKVKPFRIQREIFCKTEKELTQEEYRRLVAAAEDHKNRRLALLLQTICATGIRVSELCFITAEALELGRATVNCKGKQRVVFLPTELRRILRRYCRDRRIEFGPIFCTKTGQPLDRSNIWKDMKALCATAQVDPRKVFPHNLRHLFARTYYRLEKDLSRLADLLGHTNITTTRIYTAESGETHFQQMDRMGLVLSQT